MSFTVFKIIVPMIFVTGGTFTMGDTWGWGDSDESPTHKVTLSSFLLGETEVTYAQWEEVYDWAVSNGYHFANAGSAGNSGTSSDSVDEPVTMVNWRDVIVWCNAASEYDNRSPVYTYDGSVIRDSRDSNEAACDAAVCNWSGDGYRLPTEAEWEYAARGGNNDTDSGQYAGSSNLGDVAWYYDNSGSDTHEVKTKAANELGLYDMSGNVREWCWDWYRSDYYEGSIDTNPTGPSSGSNRVLRGGSWNYSAYYCRVTNRNNNSPNYEFINFGFRLVLAGSLP